MLFLPLVTPFPIFSWLNLLRLSRLHPKTPELPPLHTEPQASPPSSKHPHQGLAQSRHSATWPQMSWASLPSGLCFRLQSKSLGWSLQRAQGEESVCFMDGTNRGKSEQSPQGATFLPGVQSQFPGFRNRGRILAIKNKQGRVQVFLSQG